MLPPRRSGGRRGPSPLAMVLVATLVAAALFVVFGLPRWAEQRVARAAEQTSADPAEAWASEVEGQEEVPAEVAAEVAEDLESEAPAPESGSSGVEPDPTASQIAERMEEGRRALAENDGYAAALAFGRVLELEPGHAEASRGLARAERLDELRGWLAEAAQAEQQGRSSAARSAWQRVLALAPGTAEALQGLDRLSNREKSSAFSQAMSEALAALERDDLEESLSALERAEAVGQDPEEVAELRGEIAERARELQMAERARSAAALEAEERWAEARDLYGKLLEMDATLALAQDGVRRSQARAQLDQRLEAHLAASIRLSNDAVLEDARSALTRAREVGSPGPRLLSQVDRLDRLVAEVSVPVAVILQSDLETEVAVYQVGRLGRFDRRELELRPGKYTIVGTRTGYRDVRLSLVVKPGEPTSLDVRCRETI